MRSSLIALILLIFADLLPPTLCTLSAWGLSADAASLPSGALWALALSLAFFLLANIAVGLYRNDSLQSTAIFSHLRDMPQLFATLSSTYIVQLCLLWRQELLTGQLSVLLSVGWLLSCLLAMPARRFARQLSGDEQASPCPEKLLKDLRQCMRSGSQPSRILKALLEGCLAVLALLCCWPLLLLIAIAVKLTSPGPALYQARRLGKDGRPILVWKFRSMYLHAEERLQAVLAQDPILAAQWQCRQKLEQDPRVTPLGRFLRRSSLDELPQLINVLLGNMAIVGPRPITKDEVTRYGESYPIFASVLPGITGLWQVSGRNQLSYPTRVAIDAAYVTHWSIWLDLYILQKTAREILRGKGS
jgi:lipopolysaccharide/colanic/teichoic acid biosynthesis glycosyltransferase